MTAHRCSPSALMMLLLLLSVLVSGCGYKGDLKLPPEETADLPSYGVAFA